VPSPATMHRDTGMLLTARAAGPAVTVCLLALMARQHGSVDVGLYGMAAAAFSLLEAASSLGMRHLLPRELARQNDRALLGSAAVACLTTGVMLALITGVCTLWMEGRMAAVVALAAVATPLAAVAVPEEGYWLAQGKAGRLAVALLVEQGVRLILGLAMLHRGAGAEALVAVMVAGRALVVVLTLPPGGLGLRATSLPVLRRLAREVPVFLGLESVYQLYWRVDVLLLSALAPLSEVGFYVAAYRVFSAFLLLPQSYGQILLPGMMKDGGGRLLRRGIIEMLLIGAVLGLICGVGAAPMMRVVYGEGFGRASIVLAVLSLGMVLASVDQPQGRALVARGKQALDLKVLSLATACNVALNVVLIPPHGAVGAAVATIVSLAVSVSGHALALRTT